MFVTGKITNMADDTKVDFLQNLIGSAMLQRFVDHIKGVENYADEQGIQHKEVTTTKQVEEEPPPSTTEEPPMETTSPESETETPDEDSEEKPKYVGDLKIEDFVTLMYECVKTAINDVVAAQEPMETQKESSIHNQLSEFSTQLKMLSEAVNELSGDVPTGILRRVASKGVRPSESGKVVSETSHLKSATQDNGVADFLANLGIPTRGAKR